MKHYHIPSSCMKKRCMWQKVVNIVRTLDAPIVEIESETTLDLESDKTRCFNHRDELDSAVQLLKFRSVGSWTACYI